MKSHARKGGKHSMVDVLRIVLIIVFFLATAYFLLPLVSGIFHIGMVYPAAFFLMTSLMLAFPKIPQFLFSGKIKPFSVIATVLVGIVLLGVISTLITMGVKAANRPSKDDAVTVIVLGCQVRGEVPSIMLNDRIESAYNYLKENENAKCIASGGKGSGEDISEAECIKRGLTARGIDKSRIFLEDKSETTAQNLEYSAKVISDNGLSEKVAISSDNFHQLRASIFAEKNGLHSYSLGCKTFLPLSGSYYAREILGVWAALVRGY